METETGIYYFLSQKEFWLAVIVLGLLLVILIIEAVLIKTRQFSDEAAIRLVIVTIVLIGSIFLFVSGYSDKQIAPAFGLFGTICGYLFGRAGNVKDKPET
jgi:glucan phosphoethanolaminetransferase (alkaline phosphatase superfamily)